MQGEFTTAMRKNVVLGDPNIEPENRKHRVALAEWPIRRRKGVDDPRSDTLGGLIAHAHASGYEGFEISPATFQTQFFPDNTVAYALANGQRQLESEGLQVFGATLHIKRRAMRKTHFLEQFAQEVQKVRDLGGQYVSLQIFLPKKFMGDGGAYRQDEAYLAESAKIINDMRSVAWEQDMNFYVETHVGRISEDPEAFARILEMATAEVTGDLSHYLHKGAVKGPHVRAILELMNHAHVRMARENGDLSAVVDDPKADWGAEGLTWQMFQVMKPGLQGGLSSRLIVGESGNMHLQKDALGQDAKLVQVYRAIGTYADNCARGIFQKVKKPTDLMPYGK